MMLRLFGVMFVFITEKKIDDMYSDNALCKFIYLGSNDGNTLVMTQQKIEDIKCISIVELNLLTLFDTEFSYR